MFYRMIILSTLLLSAQGFSSDFRCFEDRSTSFTPLSTYVSHASSESRIKFVGHLSLAFREVDAVELGIDVPYVGEAELVIPHTLLLQNYHSALPFVQNWRIDWWNIPIPDRLKPNSRLVIKSHSNGNIQTYDVIFDQLKVGLSVQPALEYLNTTVSLYDESGKSHFIRKGNDLKECGLNL